MKKFKKFVLPLCIVNIFIFSSNVFAENSTPKAIFSDKPIILDKENFNADYVETEDAIFSTKPIILENENKELKILYRYVYENKLIS